jgi:hypothetical protein
MKPRATSPLMHPLLATLIALMLCIATIMSVQALGLAGPTSLASTGAVQQVGLNVGQGTAENARDVPEFQDGGAVQETVQQILAEPEFRHLIREKKPEREFKLPAWLERLLDWLFKNRGWRVRWPSLPVLLIQVLLYALALAAVVAALAFIARTVWDRWPGHRRDKSPLRMPDDEALAPSTPPGELPADEYVREALELAGRADYRAALRQLLLGTMSWIERAGLIRYRRGLTNRDYLRAVWRRPSCREAMAAIIGAFELVYFGRRAATADGFQHCLEQYRTGFATDETVAPLAS